MRRPGISDSSVRRLSVCLRLLRELREEGREIVSSHEMAQRCGASSAQIRKDLSLFGSFGKRGRGYSVADLIASLEEILGLGRMWNVALAGVGKIGSALLGYRYLESRGFRVVAAFDAAPEKVGKRVSGVRVSDVGDLERVLGETEVEIGIVATPPAAAQEVASRFAEAGVDAILNFAPIRLRLPDRVAVRSVDVALELEGLCYLLTAGGRAATGPGANRGRGRG